ncbi:hypothetical protein ACJMK2_018881 [Sinanodonta woodiana]|uniref:VWFD domain-containing protein n=1 Tax=Sinanodonta woodiana TaxID=1069815 RepID=A0ABD3UEP8_SINWO
MKLLLLTIAWSLLEVTKGENCDGSHMSLHDMDLRLSNNTYTCQDSGTNCITDEYISSGWYDVGSRNMPTDPSGLRTYSSCGTHYPIWLNGTVPTTSEGRQQRKVCLKTPYNECYFPSDNIEVINCGTRMLYKLSPTHASYHAYCFDPVEHVPDSATVEPGLLFRNKTGVTGQVFFKKPELYLRCQFNGNETDELYYYVSWYVNDIFLLRKGPVQLSDINDTNLYESELINGGYKLDINIKCIINSSNNSDFDSGNSTTSRVFWLGIRVLNPSVSMIQGKTTTIQLQSTFPFGCSSRADDQNQQANCLLSVSMFDPNDKNDCKRSSISVTGSQKCGVQIPGFYHHQWMPGVSYDNVTNMTITTRNTNDYDQGGNTFVLSLRTGGNEMNDIVQGSYINNIIVTTSSERSWQGKTCYAYIDPHMRSFDGRYYENQNPGVFVLYSHKSSKQEVQMRTKRCNSVAFCACALAVRAGGDLFLIDLCSSLGLIKHVSCKENILDVRQVNAYTYKIYMPLGTMVSVTINNWGLYESWLNLNIYPSVKDVQETQGLCGVLNDDQGDDFMNPFEHLETDNNVFSLSWSLSQTDSFFDPHNHSPDLWDEDSQFCVCPAALITSTLPGTSSGSQFDPLCSASISLTCSSKVHVPNQYQTCNIRTKRSKHSLSREIERILKLEVMDSDRISHNIEKRSIINITLDEALAECTDFFASNCATASFKDNLPNSNLNSMNSSITNCALDYVYTGDMSLANLHCETYRAEVEEEISRNSTFREANPDVVELFRARACINNCSNHGDCLNGSCICEDSYTEEDCSVSLINYPVVKDTYAGGLCQTDDDDCCGDVPIYGTRFVKGVTKQKLEIINIYLNGTKVVEDPIIELISILNPFEAQININCHRRHQRSADSDNSSTIFVMGTRVSLTNDGTNYGPAKSYYILDSKCQGILNDTDGGYKFYLQDGKCFISGTCYNERDQDLVDRCKRCQPTINRFSWTNECTGSNDPEAAKDNVLVIVAVCIGTFVVVMVIVIINIIKCCLKKEKRIAGHIEINVPVSTVGPSTFDKTLLFCSQQSLRRDGVFQTEWKNFSSNNTTLSNRPDTPGSLSFQKVLLEMELPEK